MINKPADLLLRKAISGVFWNNLSSYFQSIARFLGIIYLSRKIDPVFFGKQGMAAAIVAMVYSLIMFGQEYAIPRQKNNISAYMSMHVFLRLAMTMLIGIALITIYYLSGGLSNKEIFWYVIILFFSQLPSQVAVIYEVYMQRELLFGRIAFISICSVSFAVTLACVLAHQGYNIWALLWLLMGEYLMRALLTTYLTPIRFLPVFDKVMALEFFHYGKHVFMLNLNSRVQGKISDVSVGAMVGNASLGFYQRAYGLGGLLQNIVIGGVSAVITPVFATIREETERVSRYFELTGSLILRISVGGYTWMAIVLPEIIVLLYGEKWLPTVLLFQLMLPFALVQGFNLTLNNTHLVVGRSFIVSRIKFVELAVLIITLYPLISLYKTAGAAVAVDISAITGTVLLLFFLRPLVKFSLKQLFFSPVIAAASALIGWKVISSETPIFDSLIAKVIFDSLSFGLLYIIVLTAIDFSFLKRVFIALKNNR